jgi:LacI family transcriptional regulator
MVAWDGARRRQSADAVAEGQEYRVFLASLERPVAVLACNDGHGRRIADAAVEMGLRVPGELAVLGVDNDEMSCETGAIPLSSVDPDLYRVGFEAGLRLEERMRGENVGSTQMVSPKGVVRRESTSLFIHDDPDVAAALRFLYQHACDGITVEDVCGHVALSRRRFEQRFRAAVGRPPGEEIRRLRLERAKALLGETQMSLVEITRRCGYGHTPALTTAFRRAVGQSPSEYRRSVRARDLDIRVAAGSRAG